LRILGDDGEKFGAWPGTYDWVYNKGWLDDFLNHLENEPWIQSVFLKDIAQEKPAGRIYIPTSSYEEMGEWVMPTQYAKEYDELKRTVDKKYYHLIHGGYFKNFLSKYPEANLMQKRMLFASRNVTDNLDAKLSLWRGQCSCAYWQKRNCLQRP
jgi:alpha-amylase